MLTGCNWQNKSNVMFSIRLRSQLSFKLVLPRLDTSAQLPLISHSKTNQMNIVLSAPSTSATPQCLLFFVFVKFLLIKGNREDRCSCHDRKKFMRNLFTYLFVNGKFTLRIGWKTCPIGLGAYKSLPQQEIESASLGNSFLLFDDTIVRYCTSDVVNLERLSSERWVHSRNCSWDLFINNAHDDMCQHDSFLLKLGRCE